MRAYRDNTTSTISKRITTARRGVVDVKDSGA